MGTPEDNWLRAMTIEDANGRAKPEEAALLRNEDNAIAWFNTLQTLLSETKVLISSIRAEYTPLLRDASATNDYRGYRQLLKEQRERINPANAQRDRFAAKFQEASEISAGVRAELKLRGMDARDEQRAQGNRRANKRALAYGRLLAEIRDNLIAVPSFFSEAGEPLRERFQQRIEDEFAKAGDDG